MPYVAARKYALLVAPPDPMAIAISKLPPFDDSWPTESKLVWFEAWRTLFVATGRSDGGSSCNKQPHDVAPVFAKIEHDPAGAGADDAAETPASAVALRT